MDPPRSTAGLFNTLYDCFCSSTPLDFTFALTDTIAARGTDTTHQFTERLTMRGQRRFSRFASLYPHGVTHIHLPWTIDWEPLRGDLRLIKQMEEREGIEGPKDETSYRYLQERRKALALVPDEVVLPAPLGSRDSREYVLAKTRPTVLKCIVLNFSDKLETLSAFLNSKEARHVAATSERYPTIEDMLLSDRITKSELEELLVSLCITADEIKDRLCVDASDGVSNYSNPSDIFRGRAVVFYTSWNSRLRPTGERRYLASQLLECWHPYLLHPFLDLSAAKFLLEAGVAAVGSDTYGFECPLYFASPFYGFPPVRELSAAVERGDGVLSGLGQHIESCGGKEIVLPLYPPLHLTFAGTDISIIENMNIGGSIFGQVSGLRTLSIQLRTFDEQPKRVEGVLGIFPLATAAQFDEAFSFDCLLTKLYFWNG